VSLLNRLRVLLVCVTLEMGVLVGVPMRPEEIRALMNQLSRPKIAHVLPTVNDQGDKAPPDGS
jgi:hypothetical protein